MKRRQDPDRVGARARVTCTSTSTVALLTIMATAAHAAPDVEVPQLVLEPTDATTPEADEALDLANIVLSAAKGVTTVQEAPAIVTVVTADEIKDRQFQSLPDLVDTIPGWYQISIYNSTFDTPLVRGQVQAVQFLQDGVSMFDPYVNVPSINRSQPIELVKRVEMITGPGGVLWGSNSLLGILNVITKDAEDVDGVEMGATVGDGDGDRRMARAYVMGGKADLLGGHLKLFGHSSVETYDGAALAGPLLVFHDPLPLPNSANIYGPLTTTDPARSMIVNLDGKISYDKLQLRFSAPFGHMYKPFGLSGESVRDDPNALDPQGVSRYNRSDDYDRYIVAEYRTRFAHDTAGLTARAYAIEFVRDFEPLQVLAPSTISPGGLSFAADLTSYRAGGALDGDVEIGHRVRILYGGEAFNEWKPIDTTGSIEGAGTQTDFRAPYDLTRLPILCPRIYDPTTHALTPIAGCPVTFAYPADRTVLGAYVDPQWRPNDKLIFDAGARVQVAPGALGSLSYSPDTTFAGTVVWNFIPNWHLKLNFAQGFRPPVFNDTVSNGSAVQIAGNPNLKVETSNAEQAEVNARIFKGDRRIRELTFRVDGSYTRIDNLIQVESGSYQNSGTRGIAEAEFLAKLYIQGGHRLELGYTWMKVDTTDKGVIDAVPENYFNLAGVWSLIPGHLTATTNIKIAGAAVDPNRLVEYRASSYDAMGNPQNLVAVSATDLVLDRLPPMAELSFGMTWTPTKRFSLRATIYDALGGHYYQPDVFYDYEPHLEYLPNPYPGFRGYVSAMFQY